MRLSAHSLDCWQHVTGKSTYGLLDREIAHTDSISVSDRQEGNNGALVSALSRIFADLRLKVRAECPVL